jgi:hypothetical protein
MAESPHVNRFAELLLHQDQPLSGPEYQEHRMKLEQLLKRTQGRERLAVWAASISIGVAFVGMVLGGSGLIGDFDPSSKDATIWSAIVGVAYVIAWIVFFVSIVASFSRFQPRVKDLKEQLRDASILALHGEIAELRRQVATLQSGVVQKPAE